MTHNWISLFSLLDFDPTFQREIDPGRASMDTWDEDFFRVDDNNFNDEAQFFLLEELPPWSTPGRVEDPNPGTLVEFIDIDFDFDFDLDSDPQQTAIIVDEELPDRADRHGVSDMEIDVVVDPVDFGVSVGDAGWTEDLWVLDLDLDYAALLGGGRGGSAPAADRVAANLPSVELEEKDLEGGTSCAVCTEDFGEGEVVKKLPCRHYFHRDCIVPWLRIRRTCPICRFALPVSNDVEC